MIWNQMRRRLPKWLQSGWVDKNTSRISVTEPLQLYYDAVYNLFVSLIGYYYNYYHHFLARVAMQVQRVAKRGYCFDRVDGDKSQLSVINQNILSAAHMKQKIDAMQLNIQIVYKWHELSITFLSDLDQTTAPFEYYSTTPTTTATKTRDHQEIDIARATT